MNIGPVSFYILLLFAGCPVEGKPVHYNHPGMCGIRIPIHEMRGHLKGLQPYISEGDLAMLNYDGLITVKPKERCCFLRELLDLYVNRVCTQWHRALPQSARRHTSPLANTLYGIYNGLMECHCECGVDSRMKMQDIKRTFEMMDNEEAWQKALSDLDVLLFWMETETCSTPALPCLF